MPSCSFTGEYDATRLRRAVALEAECRYARSLLHAFDVARHGAVALDRINFGLLLPVSLGEVALDALVLVPLLLSDLAILIVCALKPFRVY